ncbi:hypothetical protein N24_1129 [Corynebacterium suranareeae]|uniref:Uncharacterized protein n=1 Tax=Corynebacterium suranareeae TaxID=2506452 RepID=A0A160PRF1_9CORY|nr:hypothetical protein [Corynebacterium suranareeae]BAU95391.1 hypothetical protein N24_1129 [Corynebacterium suranareeae]
METFNTGLIHLHDEAFSGVIIRKFPSTMTSERWLIIGSDWEDFSPFQSKEKGHLHISPSAPEWTELTSVDDFYTYRSTSIGGAPSSVTWFENGIWQVSEERKKQWGTLDPHKPWTDESMSWAFNSFLSDDALLELMGMRFSLGSGDNSTEGELKPHGLALKLTIENPDSDAFINYVRIMRDKEGREPFGTKEEESLLTHHKAFHEF